ncbi:hypothetical protein ABID59_001947 [Bradyrhizobium sp. S3.3.6]|uniref:Uncharacterized protein n=1 Tax=Bradyrhizobium cytisi TaxID=515489 RepID=A0A5S4VXW6_9BRAD|nr:hypothetical protein [Bradyrhizobium cytisi]TYL69848.1 hypothetical protein FXB38_42250 [Bradyrhizobium cytisi]
MAPLTRPARLPSRGSDGNATSGVADAVAQHAIDVGAEVSAALLAFIAQNSTKAFNLQLSLPCAALHDRFPLRNDDLLGDEILLKQTAALIQTSRARHLYP